MRDRVLCSRNRLNRKIQSFFSEKSYSKRNRNLLVIICLGCTLLLETFVFNLPFWQTLNAQETTYSINQATSPLSVGTGLSKQGNNLIISNTDEAYIDIHQRQNVKYLQLQSHRYPNRTTLHTLFPFNSMPENNGMRALQEHSHRQSSIHSTSILAAQPLPYVFDLQPQKDPLFP